MTGIYRRKVDPTRCMVIDCERTALYRSGERTQRGYCRLHKDRATTASRPFSDSAQSQRHTATFIDHVEHGTARQSRTRYEF